VKNSPFYKLYETADIPNDFSNLDKILGKDKPKVDKEVQTQIKDKMFEVWRESITKQEESLKKIDLEPRVKRMDKLRDNAREKVRNYVRRNYEIGKPLDWSKFGQQSEPTEAEVQEVEVTEAEVTEAGG
jgi:hypothetical protein